MTRKFLIAALLITVVALGFIRDHIFVLINNVISSGNDDGEKLFILKWVLTFLFSGLYFVHTSAMVYVLFRTKKYILMAFYSYLFLFVISFSVLIFGYLFASFDSVYPFVRKVMGIAQSPVVLMILVPACFLNERLRKDS